MDPTISWRMKKRMMRKQYADAVIQELQKKGYPGNEAKKVFYCHYRYMKREFGLEANLKHPSFASASSGSLISGHPLVQIMSPKAFDEICQRRNSFDPPAPE